MTDNLGDSHNNNHHNHHNNIHNNKSNNIIRKEKCLIANLKQLKMVLSFEVSDSRPSTPPLPPDTNYPQPPRDDKDKYTQKDKYKAKDARNSSVLMYIGCNTLWLISFVHQYKDKDKYKVMKRPNMCYIFEKPKVQGWWYLEHVW